jgi:hypothetical protein
MSERDLNQADQPYEPPAVEEIEGDTDLIATSPGITSTVN